MTGSRSSRPGGIVCPLVTPLTADGRLDEPVFRALIDALVPDLDGLFVLGSSGELTWLPDDVAAAGRPGGRRPGRRADPGVRRRRGHGARPDAGAGGAPRGSRRRLPGRRGAVLLPVAEEARVVEHFVAVADRAAAPVVLYNIPQNTHLPLAPSVVGRLAEHPNVVGLKDSAGDWFAFEQFLALRSDGFSVLQGREQLAAISLWSGADGVISALANFAPRLLRDLAASVRDERPRRETLALQAAGGRAGWACSSRATGWRASRPRSRPWAGTSASRARRSRRTTPSSGRSCARSWRRPSSGPG